MKARDKRVNTDSDKLFQVRIGKANKRRLAEAAAVLNKGGGMTSVLRDLVDYHLEDYLNRRGARIVGGHVVLKRGKR